MSVRGLLAAGVAFAACAVLSACQSTQDRSAELANESERVLLDATGLEVTKQNPDVTVTSTTLLREGQESVAVVEVHNKSGEDLANVPISLSVLDAKGREVYANDAPGLEQGLVAIPFIPARGDSVWVNDQIFAAGVPAKARVKVGVAPGPPPGERPDIEVSAPTLEGGEIASGQVVNRTGEDQRRLVLYAVARRGEKVVAAGRGAIEHLKPGTKEVPYHVYLIGDSSGADVTLTDYPTLPEGKGA